MRIAHFEKYLKEAIENLHLETTEKTVAGGREFITISEWDTICHHLHSLEEYDFIAPYVNAIFELGIQFRAPTSTLTLESSDFTQFNAKYQSLLVILKAMYDMSVHFFPKDEESQLNVKLPDEISISEMADIIAQIDFIFNRLQAIRAINGNNDVIIKRVDSGSIWFILAVTAVAVPLTGKIVKLAFEVKEKLSANEVTKQQIRAYKEGAKLMEDLGKASTAAIKIMCNEMAKQVNDEESLSLGSEELESLSVAIERIANIQFRGVEIYASLEAPKEVADKFPVQETVDVFLKKPSIHKLSAKTRSDGEE